MKKEDIKSALNGNVKWFDPNEEVTLDKFRTLISKTNPKDVGINSIYECDEFTIVIEELSELIQAISKYKRFGDNEDIIFNLHEEIADVLASVSHLIKICNLDEETIKKIINFKSTRVIRRTNGEEI